MMKKKNAFILLISILALLAILTMVYFALFTRFTIVQDESWKLVMPKAAYHQLRLKLIKNSCRLNVVTIGSDDVYDNEYLTSIFEKLDNGGFVLASPVVTASVIRNGIDLKNEFEKTTVFGIGNNNNNEFFDTVLISDPTEGWAMAAASSIKNTDKVALLYNDASLREVSFISKALTGVNYKKYNVDDYGNLGRIEIVKSLSESNINVVVCSFVDNMNEYFNEQTTQKWIVDYRFASAIRKDYLLGFVYPDIYSSLSSYLKQSIIQNNPNLGVLQYGYRKVK